jgi:2',3'-cyclic-nucleotide 2'-phosphodiesterase (5'-nucleotidase family)
LKNYLGLKLKKFTMAALTIPPIDSTLNATNIEILYRNFNTEKPKNCKPIRIIHFNDVYNIEGHLNEPVGGAARFKTALDILRKDKNTIVLFSGDAVSPSQLSLFAKGKQMIDSMNHLGITAAAIGNSF